MTEDVPPAPQDPGIPPPTPPDSPTVPPPAEPVPAAPPPAAGAALRRAPRRNKPMSMIVLLIVAGLLMWGAVKLFNAVFGGDGKKDPKDRRSSGGTIAVQVVEVKQEHFQDILSAVGTIAGGSEIPLRFEVEGPIEAFAFREGDKIKKGDVIARLNQRDVYLKYKKAQLELDQYEKLYALGGVARARLEEARLAADLARSDMDRTTLRAPKDGILGGKDAEVGEFVTPNKKIATLVNIESVVVRVGIIEKEIDKVFPGAKVIVNVDSYPNVEFSGKVENISPLVSGQSKTLTMEARMDNEGGLLLPGMFARTKIAVFEEDNAIVVPADAVEKTQTGHRVYVVNKENKAQAKDVTVGYVSTQFNQITAGLAPGELVITQKPQDLKDGSPVKVIDVGK